MFCRNISKSLRAWSAGRLMVAWLAGGLLAMVLGAAACAKGEAGTVSVRDLPPEARQVLAQIKSGHRFTHPRDGVTFYNRERLLPLRPRGYYTEYTVPTPGARNRGARRIVAGQGDTGDPATSGEYWYTSDHYASFRRIRE
ncbi:MAG: ribonuclease domain-containing protein [Pigmentiphaga sp.]|uniref:ribonuclease domain-containing protein n=1 Tax=Pigmentiphaga sp. TaxID=1977564 RepID=UPI0029B87A57|nr:ribonuclease domain-containing protein [Pigmentiphaga sp.]MDX3904746.1 ribonuclease domain-containing protein [Pigmentiphaga sp.]